MSIKKFTVLIPTYNNCEELGICIKSVRKISKYIQELIIINNGFTKMDFLKTTHLSFHIKIINNKKNVGFAKAVNMGILESKTEIILLLNPDTKIFDKSPIKLFQEINNNKDIGVIGGKLISDEQKTYYSANSKPDFLTAIFEFTNLKKIFPNNLVSKKFWLEKNKGVSKMDVHGLCGAYMFFKKYRKDKKINLFCTDYFMYLEDLDFCLTNIKNGYRVVFNPTSKIYHSGGSSSKNKYKANLNAWYKSRKFFFIESTHKINNPIARKIISNSYIIEELALYFYHKLKHEPSY